MPLSHALQLHARERPDALAFAIGEARMCYRDLWKRAREIHAALAAMPRRRRGGELPQDLPLFCLAAGNHPVAAEFLAAALALPCCVVLADPAWPRSQLAAIVDRFSPDLLVCTTHEAELAAGRVPVLRMDEAGQYSQWLSAATQKEQISFPGDDVPFLIGFTSGTTSMPKAFLRKRGSWRKSAAAGRDHFGLTSGTHTLGPGPLAHGLTLYAFMETLESGATFYGLEKFSPQAMWEATTREKPVRLAGVPTMLEALCREATGRGERLTSLRRITTAGARLEMELVGRLALAAPAAEVSEYYGASELGFVATWNFERDGAGHLRANAATAGRPFPGVAISIRENGNALGAGTDGMIHVKSALAIDGYLSGGDGSGLRRDGEWVSVGDIGRVDDKGLLTLIGRSGDMVITGGYNVYPDEITAFLRNLSGVAKALTLGSADPYLGQALVALIQFEPGQCRSAARLASECRAGLARYKIPRKFFALSEWPMTSSGKIARGTIAKWIETNDERLLAL